MPDMRNLVLVCASACWAFRLPPLPPPRTASRLVRPRATLDHHDVATDGLASTVERALQQQNFAAVACLDSEPVLDVAARVFSGGGAGQRAAAALVYRNASSSADNSLELSASLPARYCRGPVAVTRSDGSFRGPRIAWPSGRRAATWFGLARPRRPRRRHGQRGFRHLVVTDDARAARPMRAARRRDRAALSLGDIVGLAEADDTRAARAVVCPLNPRADRGKASPRRGSSRARCRSPGRCATSTPRKLQRTSRNARTVARDADGQRRAHRGRVSFLVAGPAGSASSTDGSPSTRSV